MSTVVILETQLLANVSPEMLMEGFKIATEKNDGKGISHSHPSIPNTLYSLRGSVRLLTRCCWTKGVPVEHEMHKTLQQGCATSLVAALSPQLKGLSPWRCQ